jgi:D-amino peptidase
MPHKLSVFISFDLEGVSGISSWKEVERNTAALKEARENATEEVNAAIRGASHAMHIRDIVVCDAHASGENLIIGKLEKGITVVRGTPRPYYMVEGISSAYDVLFCVGYHAMAGTHKAGMDHTYSGASIYRIKINGAQVGETAINAAVAGHYGVPVGLVTGDDRLIKEAKMFFGDGIETVTTKFGISRFAARCRHPRDVQKDIELKASKVMKKVKRLKPFTFRSPLRAEFELSNTLIADYAELIPGIKRTAARSLGYKARTILEFYRILRLVCSLGALARRGFSS